MINNTVNILSINFNYDLERNMIIESRCIKRETKDTNGKKQYLKGNVKEYSADLVPEIYKDLQNTRILIFEKELSSEQTRVALAKTFDLFEDIERIMNDNDSEEMIHKIKLSQAAGI